MPEPKRPLKVFLCHAHADRDAVRALYTRLTDDGVDAWLDKEKLLPGQDWELEIKKAVREADVVVVCLSKQFNQRGFRQKEVRLALDTAMEMPEGEIFIIPARLEECENLESLRKWHWVNLFESNGYEMLMRALRARADRIGATLQIKRSWRLPKITNSFPKKQKSIEVREAKASQTIALNTTDDLPKKTEYPDGWDTEWQPVIETDKPNIVRNPQEKKTSAPKPKKRFQLPKVPNRNFMGVFGFVVLVMVSILGLPSLFNSPVEAPSPTQTENVVVLDTQTPKSSSTPSIPTSTKTPEFTATPTPLPTEITDAKGITMRFVPAGEFTMGSENGDDDEKPVHRVYLDAFYMDIYEVTNAAYKVCEEANGCTPPERMESSTRPSYYNNPLFKDYPVITVDWFQANAYCEWRGSSLPTDAQWEKAARGTDERTYPWGEGIDCYKANYQEACIGDTTEVGSYLDGVSPYGLYDMAGNVWEWMLNLESPEIGEIRGGSYNYYVKDARSTNRFKILSDYHFSDLGFRCAKDAKP